MRTGLPATSEAGADSLALSVSGLRPAAVRAALMWSRAAVMIGSPDDVARKIEALRDDMGLDGVLVELNCGGKVEHAHEMEALRLLCQDVMPKFH